MQQRFPARPRAGTLQLCGMHSNYSATVARHSLWTYVLTVLKKVDVNGELNKYKRTEYPKLLDIQCSCKLFPILHRMLSLKSQCYSFLNASYLWFRPIYRSGCSLDWWPDRRRWWTAERNHRSSAESSFGAEWVELPSARLPDHWVGKPGGSAAHRGTELWQATVEQSNTLR